MIQRYIAIFKQSNTSLEGYTTGFSDIVVTDTSFSTKLNTGLPADIVNASWGESRYVVVFPINEDGIIG